MTESDFIDALASLLEQHSESARGQLRRLLASLPERVTQLDIEVFPAQDGDGFFTIRASVEGPDLYVINKAIAEHAELFAPKHTAAGVAPPIPLVDAFNVSFPVNDIVVDCAANWLQSVWQTIGEVNCRVRVVITGHDDYGTVTPVELHGGAGA